jgi:nucleotide-binding universal stress UspA family protein
MFKRILVPLDGSELAERALAPAMALARRQQAEVILLTVPAYRQVLVAGGAGYGLLLPEQSLQESRDGARSYLDGIAERYPDVAVRAIAEDGDVAGTIVDAAADLAADLIVMTTHGYSGFTRWVLGSVTERVLHEAACPVLVIRYDRPLANVVITLDGSWLAEQALEPGLALARQLGAQVTLLRVDHEARLSAFELGMLEAAGAGLGKQIAQTEGLGRVASYLEYVAGQHRRPGDRLETVVVDGQPPQAILEFVEANEVDLVVMATHGHTGLRRWVYGSVTEKVLHSADCAMLIVRPPAEALK